MVRVAILSDTHGQLDRRVAEIVESCDYAAHAGDLGCAAVARALRPRAGVRVIVRGNNDVPRKWPGDRGLLDELPEEASLELPGGLLQLVHGDRAGRVSQRHRWLRERYPQARAVVYGHSHRLQLDTSTRPWVLNPGAAGVSRTFGGPSLIVLSASETRWRVKPIRYALPAQKSRLDDAGGVR